LLDLKIYFLEEKKTKIIFYHSQNLLS